MTNTVEGFIADCNNRINVWINDYKEKRQAENESFDGLMNAVSIAISSYGNLITQLCQSNLQLTQRIEQCERNTQGGTDLQQSIQQLSNEISTLKKGNHFNKEDVQKLYASHQMQTTDLQQKMAQSMNMMKTRSAKRKQMRHSANGDTTVVGKPINVQPATPMAQPIVVNGTTTQYQKPPNPFTEQAQPTTAVPQLHQITTQMAKPMQPTQMSPQFTQHVPSPGQQVVGQSPLMTGVKNVTFTPTGQRVSPMATPIQITKQQTMMPQSGTTPMAQPTNTLQPSQQINAKPQIIAAQQYHPLPPMQSSGQKNTPQ